MGGEKNKVKQKSSLKQFFKTKRHNTIVNIFVIYFRKPWFYSRLYPKYCYNLKHIEKIKLMAKYLYWMGNWVRVPPISYSQLLNQDKGSFKSKYVILDAPVRVFYLHGSNFLRWKLIHPRVYSGETENKCAFYISLFPNQMYKSTNKEPAVICTRFVLEEFTRELIGKDGMFKLLGFSFNDTYCPLLTHHRNRSWLSWGNWNKCLWVIEKSNGIEISIKIW